MRIVTVNDVLSLPLLWLQFGQVVGADGQSPVRRVRLGLKVRIFIGLSLEVRPDGLNPGRQGRV